jgi:excinuclease ABC subunit B
MYADKITDSMRKTMDETARRRKLQTEFNEMHGLVPTALNKSKEKIMESTKVADGDLALRKAKYEQPEISAIAAEEIISYGNPNELEKHIKSTRKAMEKAAKELDFIEAARLRDLLFELEKKIKNGK